MSATDGPIDIATFADDRRVSPFQLRILALCGLLMLVDGFDNMMISYMVPHIAREWGLSKLELGPIFAAAPLGTVIGYLVTSPLAARLGHRRVILFFTTSFALLNLLCLVVKSVEHLIILRFFLGIGLGAIVPSTITITSEFSPRRFRASSILFIFCFLSFGIAIAGFVSGLVIPRWGWRAMFWLGAIAPGVLVLVMLRGLPEPPSSLIQRGEAGRRTILGYYRKIDPSVTMAAALSQTDDTSDFSRTGPRGLFEDRLGTGTLLLWLLFVLGTALSFALQSWLPTLLTELDHPTSVVVTASSMLAVGGIVIALVVGPAMDRIGEYGTLAVLFTGGFASLLLLGTALTGPDLFLVIAAFLTGCCIMSSLKSLVALTATFYPPSLRSTGSGWALGIGRLGGVAGPLVVGALLGSGWTPQSVIFALSAPVLTMAAIILLLRSRYVTRV